MKQLEFLCFAISLILLFVFRGDDFKLRERGLQTLLIISALLPVAGVLLEEWPLRYLMLVYLLESMVLGALTALDIATLRTREILVKESAGAYVVKSVWAPENLAVAAAFGLGFFFVFLWCAFFVFVTFAAAGTAVIRPSGSKGLEFLWTFREIVAPVVVYSIYAIADRYFTRQTDVAWPRRFGPLMISPFYRLVPIIAMSLFAIGRDFKSLNHDFVIGFVVAAAIFDYGVDIYARARVRTLSLSHGPPLGP
ncbi:MAG TPA: DUF6498-containing protein [Bdellovibrionales bacterium]|nr:DUF6498-containing protein [Bdellovibrionales bacterium]